MKEQSAKLNKPIYLGFLGLSGVGKTTIANLLTERLRELDYRVLNIDEIHLKKNLKQYFSISLFLLTNKDITVFLFRYLLIILNPLNRFSSVLRINFDFLKSALKLFYFSYSNFLNTDFLINTEEPLNHIYFIKKNKEKTRKNIIKLQSTNSFDIRYIYRR